MKDGSRILIVDDDEATLTALAGLLELEGYLVEKARNGKQALEKLSAGAPDLILLDLKMPVMDGWQFLSERAKDASAGETPVVLLSGLPFIPNAPGVADSDVDMRDTFLTTHHLLKILRAHGVPRLAFASTSAIYGVQPTVLTEDTLNATYKSRMALVRVEGKLYAIDTGVHE